MADNYIGLVTAGGNENMPIGASLYGTCSTAAGTAQKDVTLSALNRIFDGLTVHIKFTTANTSAAPTLKFSGMPSDAAAIAIKNYGVGSSVAWAAGALISFTYDGTNWVMNDNNNTGTVTGVTINATSPVAVNSTSAITTSGTRTISLSDGYGDTKNPYAAKAKNLVLAGPGTGSDAAPTFRALVDADIPSGIARLAGPTFTGTPKAPTAAAGTNTTQIATTEFVTTAVGNAFGANDAMIYKGLLDSTISTETATTKKNVPASGYSAGWTYRVNVAGTYAGATCEVGDLLIAVTDGPASGTTVTNSHWTVAQTNIDGAVTTTGGTSGSLAKFNGNNSIVSGPAFTTSYDSSTAVTTSHKFLREDGTWVVPKYTANANGYGKVTVSAQSTAVAGLTGGSAAVTVSSKGANEALKFTTSNKWIVVTGTESSTAGSDEIKFAHAVPSSIANTAPTANQTGTRGSTFNIPKITIDEAGHVTALEAITVSLPASDNSHYTTHLYINTTSGGKTENVATANTTTYMHLYDETTRRDTIQFKGAGNITVASTNAKVVTITGAAFAGATASADGTGGYLPAPGAGNQAKFLQGSGSWKTLSLTTGTLPTLKTGTTFSIPNVTTMATASVSNGVLTITNGALGTAFSVPNITGINQGAFPTLSVT